MSKLFDPIQIRELTIPNRVWMSPMCTYSAPVGTGMPTDFHQAHYAARAAGGVGLVMVEATGVSPVAPISPVDLGLWADEQVEPFSRITAAIRAGGAVPAVQLAHAGRKASTSAPWEGGDYVAPENNGWETIGPSALAFPGLPAPHELTISEIAEVVQQFADAAVRADKAGFDVVEIHAAHGYLLHNFLSPISNKRTDAYGGPLENRARIVLEVIEAIRQVWPAEKPVFMRISTTDWVEENPHDDRDSWTLEQSKQLALWAAAHGVDLIDASSGGLDVVPIPRERNYQTAKAAELRANTNVLVAAVGRIDDAETAHDLIESDQADAVFLGRPLLKDPSWANHAALSLGATPRYVRQYDYVL
ncbi:NADH:flavin oxidoreductase [Corynebacterium suranareeae]|uniref:NADH:flavin oxidoreductase n=1 Tax=Corynebacterium suranareeae TaxID=2506452 RepID=A0A169SBX2_9CORY|nr:NADH:flavin oxidoreductase/NADH oxidase [Corynebacterium suranareeae]BAU97396.1 NADH:flavin oxidoreductase [Corynebacterium suranareeae]